MKHFFKAMKYWQFILEKGAKCDKHFCESEAWSVMISVEEWQILNILSHKAPNSREAAI